MERTYTTPRLGKLGVRPGSRVVLVGVTDPDLRANLETRTSDVSEADRDGQGMPTTSVDLVGGRSAPMTRQVR